MNERVIFEAALEIADPAARQKYLDRACMDDPELRLRLEALLQSHATASGFLGTPVIEQMSDQTIPTGGAAGPELDVGDYQKTHCNSAQEFQGDEAVSLTFLSSSNQPDSLGRLGHYEVHQVLGQGSFGVVLKAFDEKLHRLVAIKVMSSELAATSPARKRFLREARAAAAIRHENVVAVYAVEEQPIPYLVMEYIPGLTLDQALNQHGPLDVADVLRLGREIASGLAAAHAQGLIHRDIKPANILLENGLSGRVKITDFGLARTTDDACITQSGMIAGTPMYMSPEQATGGVIDPRSDLFSLGSVLYVMVSGRLPFRAATTLAVLKRVVEDTPRPIAEIISETPPWLCDIIAKLQAKSPVQRFDSSCEIADVLGSCLDDLRAERPIQLRTSMRVARSHVAETVEMQPPRTAKRDEIAPTAASPQPRRWSLQGWSRGAAIIFVLLGGLGLTESTGVTKLASTVIRMTTGSGTLVIQVDDPNIKVNIDGEEVHIQGAGVEQLTLKPGKYRVSAIKDGMEVTQQFVTITRGGREMVRATMNVKQATAPQPTIATSVAAQAKHQQEALPQVADKQAAAQSLTWPEMSAPPQLDEWLKGREVLTVKQDGTAMFTTIQAALHAQKDGQVVRVLDKGPYTETLDWQRKSDCGLVTGVGTVVIQERWRKLPFGGDILRGHHWSELKNCRVSGFDFISRPLNENHWQPMQLFKVPGLCVEECVVIVAGADAGPSDRYISVYPDASHDVELPVCFRNCVIALRFEVHTNGGERVLVSRNWIQNKANAAVFLAHYHEETPTYISVQQNVTASEKTGGVWRLREKLDRLHVRFQHNTVAGSSDYLIVFTEPAGPAVEIEGNLNLQAKFTSVAFVEEGTKSLALARDKWIISRNFGIGDAVSNSMSLPLTDRSRLQPIQILSTDPLHRNYLRVDPGSIKIPDGDPFPGALPPGPAPADGDWFTRLQDRWKIALESLQHLPAMAQ